MSFARCSGALVAGLTFFVGQGVAFGADYGAKGPESSTEAPLDVDKQSKATSANNARAT
jgi:hypothetical protein